MTAPVDKTADFPPPPEVSPLRPGSVSVISSSTKLGGVTPKGAPFQSVTTQTSCSLSHLPASPTTLPFISNCSKSACIIKCQCSPSWYRYCISTSITLAPSTVSPDLKVFSSILP